MQTAQEIYTSTIRELPVEERLRLAALILNDLAPSDSLNMLTTGPLDEEGVSDAEFQAALDWVNARYSDALQRLAE